MALPLRRIALSLSAALLIGALGVTLGAHVVSPPVPDSLSAPSAISSAPVTTRQVNDERSIRLTVSASEAKPITAPRAGRITALHMTPGMQLSSGQIAMDIDGLPVAALHTTTPLYRPIANETSGEDIRALQEELVRLGYDISTNGTVTWGTRFATADLLGIDDGNGGVPDVIPHEHFLWIPAASVNIDDVKVQLGGTTDPNSPLVTLSGGASSASLTLPNDAQPGERIITLESKDYPVPENGIITDQTVLQAILTSTPYRNTMNTSDDKESDASFTVPWKLATPIDVQIVPPGALFGIRGDSACVSTQGTTIKVRIISSELGQTFINTDTPLTDVDMQVEGLPCQ